MYVDPSAPVLVPFWIQSQHSSDVISPFQWRVSCPRNPGPSQGCAEESRQAKPEISQVDPATRKCFTLLLYMLFLFKQDGMWLVGKNTLKGISPV